jgi:hypothetical protein
MSETVAGGLGKAMMVSHRRRVQWCHRQTMRRAGVRRDQKEKKGGALRRGAPLKAA